MACLFETCKTWLSGIQREACSCSSHAHVGMLKWIVPPALRELHFGTLFDQLLADTQLPDTLRALIFGASFSQCIDNVRLPPRLEQLCYGNNFTGGGCRLPFSRWPVSLRHRAGGLFTSGGSLQLVPAKNRFACDIAALGLGIGRFV